MAQNYKVESPAPVRRVVPPSVLLAPPSPSLSLSHSHSHTFTNTQSFFLLSLSLSLSPSPSSSRFLPILFTSCSISISPPRADGVTHLLGLFLIASVVIIPTKRQQTLIPAYCSLITCKLALIIQSSAPLSLPPLSFAHIELGQQRIWESIQFPTPVKHLRALYRHPEAGTVDCPCVSTTPFSDPHTYTTTPIAVAVVIPNCRKIYQLPSPTLRSE